MTFDGVLEQALEMLQRRGRVSYRALKAQFQLDDTLLEILKAEIVEVHQLARDQEGKMLVWTGDAASPAVPASAPAPDQGRAPLCRVAREEENGIQWRWYRRASQAQEVPR